MKKQLIGACNNIVQNRNKIARWANSFRKQTGGDVYLVAINPTTYDIDICKELNIKYYGYFVEDTTLINNKRLLPTADVIEQFSKNDSLWMVTDVFDVVFQGDPFLSFDLDNYNIFVGSEGVKISEEPWNADVISKCFPEDLSLCKDKEILCSGVIGGKGKALIPLLKKMYEMCERGGKHPIRDQAALIVMAAKNEIPRLKVFNLNDAWVCHCAIAGPTQFFKSWGFENILLKRYNIPYLKDGRVYTADGALFDIVHQFNRIPSWDKQLTEYEGSSDVLMGRV